MVACSQTKARAGTLRCSGGQACQPERVSQAAAHARYVSDHNRAEGCCPPCPRRHWPIDVLFIDTKARVPVHTVGSLHPGRLREQLDGKNNAHPSAFARSQIPESLRTTRERVFIERKPGKTLTVSNPHRAIVEGALQDVTHPISAARRTDIAHHLNSERHQRPQASSDPEEAPLPRERASRDQHHNRSHKHQTGQHAGRNPSRPRPELESVERDHACATGAWAHGHSIGEDRGRLHRPFIHPDPLSLAYPSSSSGIRSSPESSPAGGFQSSALGGVRRRGYRWRGHEFRESPDTRKKIPRGRRAEELGRLFASQGTRARTLQRSAFTARNYGHRPVRP
ncbi:hypothetical protein N136_00133 [Leifsonia aquatica ATCC 14665]|uniref:Uncharacterized protein n=1 Tax=Leifsonia aquatica ATCC 14665 TaxID=1358026 RepID=U2RE93_LEIAQ|nr:hypothetical protein N136_00133 [Leifsonia aquatica ATCC 14665]